MSVPLSFDRVALHAAYAAGLGPSAVIAEALRRLSATGDPAIFIHLRDREELMAEAEALGPFDPQSRPLWGLPFAVKDNIDVAGCPTTAACPTASRVAEDDAAVVAALRTAGAIPIGKTNLDQFATGLVGTRSPYGVPRNAIDPTLVPGGSSSGSAVATALGIVTFALGTDTAGSGRVPAALNGIVGLKPSLGAFSNRGVVPACRTLDCVSVFAASVADAWAVFRAAAVFDPMDPFARPVPAPPLGAPAPALRIAVPDAAGRLFFGDGAQETAFTAALHDLAALGAEIVEVDFSPFFETAALLYEGAWVAERLTVVDTLLAESPDALHPVTRRIIEPAAGLSAADAFRGLYRLAELKRATAPVLGAVDALCVPTIPTPVTLEEDAADPVGFNARLGTYTNFVNLLDLCGLAVPTARRPDGLPGSITLLAGSGRDAALAALGAALQARAGLPAGATGIAPPSAAASTAADTDELPLAVVGAHMSGLPLNGELTRLGGRFLFAGHTAPRYRLYALAGGPPARPGMVRAEDGAAIALEVWALPRRAVGDFLAGIPSPLGLGTVELADGARVHGFLCETAGLEGARDITALGGWRAFLQAEAEGRALRATG